jgi:hypothetical protein
MSPTHSSAVPRMRRLAMAIVVIGLLCVGALAATPASAATWTGTTHGKFLRSDSLLSGGTSWRGSFWFTTDREGRVRGRAVVGYEPSVDVTGLNAAITYIRDITTVPISALAAPFGAAITAVGPGQIVGTSVSFRESMAVRRGRISGLLRGGRLNLRWNGSLADIPYDINFRLATEGTQKIGDGTLGLPDPFPKAADVIGRRHAESSSQSESKPEGVTQRVGSYWVAHRLS